ncbi:MAG: hypothetical protein WAM60_02140, partial [Candidatus Promineifilaceae bacterium]
MTRKEKRFEALDRQIGRLQRRLAELEQVSERYSYLRLFTFLGGFVLNGAVFLTVGAGWLWLSFLGAAVLFLSVVYIHNRVETVITRYRIWLAQTERQQARMALDWERLPPSQFRPESALALDLDLVGTHSLHRLVNTAVSRQGSLRLEEWLTSAVSSPAVTLERQERVRELVDRPLFRKRLTLNGVFASGKRESASPERLLQWLQAHEPDPTLRKWVLGLGALAAVDVALLIANLLGLIPPLWEGTLVV